MKIKDLRLIPPSKQSSAVLIEFMNEHEKGLKAIKALTEIKPILEFYAIGKVGEEQPNGTYKFSGRYIEADDLVCIEYDPNPAKEALRKISEVENG